MFGRGVKCLKELEILPMSNLKLRNKNYKKFILFWPFSLQIPQFFLLFELFPSFSSFFPLHLKGFPKGLKSMPPTRTELYKQKRIFLNVRNMQKCWFLGLNCDCRSSSPGCTTSPPSRTPLLLMTG